MARRRRGIAAAVCRCLLRALPHAFVQHGARGGAAGGDHAPKFTPADEEALKFYLRNSNKAGLEVPWVWVRDQLAQAWQCFPWEVDEAPAREVALKLRLLNIEAEYREWLAQQRRRG